MISPLARSSVHDTMLRDSWTMIYATFPMYGMKDKTVLDKYNAMARFTGESSILASS